MNLSETIKNIRATCDNYVNPDLLAFIIDDDNTWEPTTSPKSKDITGTVP